MSEKLNFKRFDLWTFASLGRLEDVKRLLEKEGTLGVSSHEEWMYVINRGLEHATYAGHLSVADYFIACGADALNHCLCIAADQGNLKMVKYLLRKGADDWQGALIRGIQNKHQLIIEFFSPKIQPKDKHVWEMALQLSNAPKKSYGDDKIKKLLKLKINPYGSFISAEK